MKASQILYEAAEYAFDHAGGACGAIDNAFVRLRRGSIYTQDLDGKRAYALAEKYFRYLAPQFNTSTSGYWWQAPDWQTPHEPRVLGLLFVAAMAESEGN